MIEILICALALFCFITFLNLKTINFELLLLKKQLIKHIETDKLLDKCDSDTNVIPFNRKDC